MNRATRIAQICDYLRSKQDIAAFIDDALLIDDMRKGQQEKAQERARELLDHIESLNAEFVGNFFIDRLLEAYKDKELKDPEEA